MEENDVLTRERIARIEEKIDFLRADIDKLTAKVDTLEGRPAKRWDSIITAVLAALGGGVGGAIFTKLIGG